MTTAPLIIGIDLGKSWFHLVGLDGSGTTILRKETESGAARPFCGHRAEMHRGDRVVPWFAVLGQGFTAGGPRDPDSGGACGSGANHLQDKRHNFPLIRFQHGGENRGQRRKDPPESQPGRTFDRRQIGVNVLQFCLDKR